MNFPVSVRRAGLLLATIAVVVFLVNPRETAGLTVRQHQALLAINHQTLDNCANLLRTTVMDNGAEEMWVRFAPSSC